MDKNQRYTDPSQPQQQTLPAILQNAMTMQLQVQLTPHPRAGRMTLVQKHDDAPGTEDTPTPQAFNVSRGHPARPPRSQPGIRRSPGSSQAPAARSPSFGWETASPRGRVPGPTLLMLRKTLGPLSAHSRARPLRLSV